MYVHDTCVLSEVRKIRLGRADPGVAAFAETIDAGDLYISAVTVMELELGALSLESRDAAQGAVLRAWLDEYVLPEFSGQILSIDTVVAKRCARLQVPDRRGERDAMIAATALVHGMAVVTRNVADFEPTVVPVINPWTS
jgi:predicted nucleic acid-binding protein